MRFSVTPDDFLKGELPEPGWHPAQIVKWDDTKVAGSAAKNPGSTVIAVTFKIVAGKGKDKVIFQNFSEVAPAFMVPLLEALGNNFNKKETVSFEVTQTAMEGKLVDIHLIPAVFNNKPKREIDGYKPYSGPKVITEQVAGV